MPTATRFKKADIKVLLLENIHASAVQLLAAEGYQVETQKGALKEDELRKKAVDFHVLGIRSKTHVTAAFLADSKRLLGVGCFCIGTNQVALVDANRQGVPVFNAPFSSTRSVAELILGEIIVLARQLGDRVREVHAGQWKKVAAGCREVRGKTLGIIGYGHIGSQVGVLAEGLGMRVLFHDIVTKLPIGNCRLASLHELLSQSDFVTLHVPETPQTKGMIGEPELAVMRPGACLLNASRGSVVQIPALAAALRSGALGGASVDVYPEEPEANTDAFKSELQGLPNVLLTPHIGGSTEEAQEAIGREVATSIIRLVNTGATGGSVNFPQVDLPQSRGKSRVINVHRNVPGVLRDINKAVSDQGGNIHSQVLSTDPNIGYLIMDLDQDVSQQVLEAIRLLPTSITTRIID